MNRAVGRRSFFETKADADVFFERIGEVVERGWMQVHAFTVLTTHFHLLVRSPVGELSRALRHVQLGYVRYFNRSRRRDGPLVRGRFRSLLVESLTYRRVLVRYIDANAPQAGIVKRPADHAFGSCRAYVTGAGPAWLQRDWVEAEVCERMAARAYDGSDYEMVFGAGLGSAQRELVERRIAGRRVAAAADPLDSLLSGASPAVLDWLVRKAKLADGTLPGLPLAAAESIDAALADSGPSWPQMLSEKDWPRTNWRMAAHALLLRDLAGLTFDEVGRRQGTSRERARVHAERGRAAVRAQAAFARRVAVIAAAALARTHAGRAAVGVARRLAAAAEGTGVAAR